MSQRTSILAASAALALGIAFAPVGYSEPTYGKRYFAKKRGKSKKATKSAKLHALQRKARRIQRTNKK